MRDRGHPTLATHDRTNLNNRIGVKSVASPPWVQPVRANTKNVYPCTEKPAASCPIHSRLGAFPREYRGKSAPTASPSRGRLVIS